MDVYSAAGRRVATLLDGPVSAGRHELDWDGHDGDGRALPSGVYFIRLTFDGEVDTGRAILLR